MLSGKRAVITGGSDGIGFGIARNEERLKESDSSLSQFGGEIDVLAADLSDVSAVKKAAQEILKICPEVDVLVNNAGTARFNPFTETDDAELDMHLNLNVRAPYVLTRQLFDALASRKGSIINISSYFSHRMLPGRPSTAYSLTKGAMDAFTKSLANEAGPRVVRVNAIAPGTVNTSLVQANIERLTDEGKTRFAEMIRTIYPLGRIGQPDDISGAAVFLVSDQARWITGAILAVDGGLTTN